MCIYNVCEMSIVLHNVYFWYTSKYVDTADNTFS